MLQPLWLQHISIADADQGTPHILQRAGAIDESFFFILLGAEARHVRICCILMIRFTSREIIQRHPDLTGLTWYLASQLHPAISCVHPQSVLIYRNTMIGSLYRAKENFVLNSLQVEIRLVCQNCKKSFRIGLDPAANSPIGCHPEYVTMLKLLQPNGGYCFPPPFRTSHK